MSWTKELWYLASPYSHPDPEVREQRYIQVRDYMLKLKESGINAISPIVLWHDNCKEYNLPYTHEYWNEYNRQLKMVCNGIIVLMIDGVLESRGVLDELKYFEKKKKIQFGGDPRKYIDFFYTSKPDLEKEFNLIWGLILKHSGVYWRFDARTNREPYNDLQHLLIYIYIEYLGLTTLSVAKQLKFHHSTLLYHHKEISNLIEFDLEYQKLYNKVIKELGESVK